MCPAAVEGGIQLGANTARLSCKLLIIQHPAQLRNGMTALFVV